MSLKRIRIYHKILFLHLHVLTAGKHQNSCAKERKTN